MNTHMMKKLAMLILCVVLGSCGSLRTFHEYARAGDTVAVPIGLQKDFNKSNITVTFTPTSGSPIVINASDPAIRAIVNFYPDPMSSMNISREIQTNLTPASQTYGDVTLFNAGGDRDYYQTILIVDLPASLPVGLADVSVTNGLGDSHTASLDIIAGVGTPNTFNSDFNGGLLLDNTILESLERVPHYIVEFTSASVPNAIEVTFTHDPDASVGGAGKNTVINPVGFRKSLHWSDNGTDMKIIMTESKNGEISDIIDYKFYIAGTATNLIAGTVAAYDNNGDVIPGVTFTLTASN